MLVTHNFTYLTLCREKINLFLVKIIFFEAFKKKSYLKNCLVLVFSQINLG